MVEDAEARVDREVEALVARMEKIKTSTRSSLLKFFGTCFAIFLGMFMRNLTGSLQSKRMDSTFLATETHHRIA